jgi:putative ABC transport system substrate-binding protein
MRRRAFIEGIAALAAALWPLAARAQQPGERMPRVGVLRVLAESDSEGRSWVNALEQGLVELGWNDGLNIKIDVRAGGGEVNQIQKFAKELVDLHPDVIVAMTTPSALAIVRETHTIPIVFAMVTDPIAQGVVGYLACRCVRVDAEAARDSAHL